jgi:hypothetical protein
VGQSEGGVRQEEEGGVASFTIGSVFEAMLPMPS